MSNFQIILVHMQCENYNWKSLILLILILLLQICSYLSESCNFLSPNFFSISSSHHIISYHLDLLWRPHL